MGEDAGSSGAREPMWVRTAHAAVYGQCTNCRDRTGRSSGVSFEPRLWLIRTGQRSRPTPDVSSMEIRLPDIVAHADWSANPPGRQIAIARRTGARFAAAAPIPIGALDDLVPALIAEAGPAGTALLGVDFPIGLPRAYAAVAGIADFRRALTRFGHGRWRDFYTPAESAAEITLHRPFYPMRSGAKGAVKRADLPAALGLPGYDDLHRICDRGHPDRAAAAALFWLVGANQVGKAAICGWRDLLAPALRRRQPVRLWPFDGRLATLLDRPGLVIAETYPGEIYGHLDLAIGGPRRAKTRQADRAGDAAALTASAARLGIDLADAFAAAIDDGFGGDIQGDDRFDAAVGLFGMINILRGYRAPGDPRDRLRRTVEGWILGQAEPAGGRQI